MGLQRVLFVSAFYVFNIQATIPLWNIKLAQEQGPNVCVMEEASLLKHKVWTECKYWKPRDICGQKPLLRYECCQGYKRVPGTIGCIGVKPLKNVLETAKELGVRLFIKYIEESGLTETFTNEEGPITLFIPSDDAMRELSKENKLQMERYKGDKINPIIMYHILNDRIPSSNFKADMLLETKHEGQKVRINKFSSKVETVNCISIIQKDHEATNGIIHVINGVLDPLISSLQNIANIIVHDGRFNQFARILEQSGINSIIRRSENPMTILAPSDEAFQKLPASYMAKLIKNDYSKELLIKNHILSHTLCLPAIIGKHKLRTESDHRIVFDCDKKGISLNGNTFNTQMLLGRNGVIYVMENIMLPSRVKNLLQLVEEEGLDSFFNLIRTAELEEAFNDFGDYTLFIPSEEAMLALSTERYTELQENKDEARKFVLHHGTQRGIKTSNMLNNEEIMSLDEKHPLTLQVGRKSFGVDGALIEKPDIEGINGVIHIISKVLTPINNTWHDLIKNNETFSMFLEAVEKTSGINSEETDLNTARTLFVPTNEAFQRLGHYKLSYLMNNASNLQKVLRNHCSQTVITTELLSPGLLYYMNTEGEEVEIIKDGENIKVNKAHILKSDQMTKNGVIHVIDRVLLSEKNNDDN